MPTRIQLNRYPYLTDFLTAFRVSDGKTRGRDNIGIVSRLTNTTRRDEAFERALTMISRCYPFANTHSPLRKYKQMRSYATVTQQLMLLHYSIERLRRLIISKAPPARTFCQCFHLYRKVDCSGSAGRLRLRCFDFSALSFSLCSPSIIIIRAARYVGTIFLCPVEIRRVQTR